MTNLKSKAILKDQIKKNEKLKWKKIKDHKKAFTVRIHIKNFNRLQ